MPGSPADLDGSGNLAPSARWGLRARGLLFLPTITVPWRAIDTASRLDDEVLPTVALGSGKDSPMPCVLNLIYATLLAALSPVLMLRSYRTGRYRDGWGRSSSAGPPGGSAIARASGSTR